MSASGAGAALDAVEDGVGLLGVQLLHAAAVGRAAVQVPRAGVAARCRVGAVGVDDGEDDVDGRRVRGVVRGEAQQHLASDDLVAVDVAEEQHRVAVAAPAVGEDHHALDRLAAHARADEHHAHGGCGELVDEQVDRVRARVVRAHAHGKKQQHTPHLAHACHANHAGLFWFWQDVRGRGPQTCWRVVPQGAVVAAVERELQRRVGHQPRVQHEEHRQEVAAIGIDVAVGPAPVSVRSTSPYSIQVHRNGALAGAEAHPSRPRRPPASVPLAARVPQPRDVGELVEQGVTLSR